MGGAGLRARAVAESYFLPLVAVCVVLAAVGGALAAGAAGADTRTEIRQTTTWESSASFDHRAQVVRDTDVYAAGDVLRNRGTYFQRVTPALSGSLTYSYTASEGGDLRANTSGVLVLRSVSGADATEGGDDPAEVYWRSESVLTSDRVAGVAPGEPVRVPFRLNVTRAADRLAAIDEQFGGTPGQKELFVLVRVDLAGTRNGRSVDRTRTYRLPIDTDGTVYTVEDPGTVTDSGGQRREVAVPASPGPVRAVGAPLLALVGLAGVAALAGARYTGRLSLADAERAWLDYRSHREEFDDWITVAVPPGDAYAGDAITVESLEGLVDVAIDTDRRVLEDPGRDTFVVLAEEYVYRYSPPPEPGGEGDVLVGPDADDRSEEKATDETASGADAFDPEPEE
jgi:hypothetical protein